MTAYRETHPGAILAEELQARRLSTTALAIRLRVAPRHVRAIVAGKRGISAGTALRLGRYFGNEPAFWLALQSAHDLALLRRVRGKRIAAGAEVVG